MYIYIYIWVCWVRDDEYGGDGAWPTRSDTTVLEAMMARRKRALRGATRRVGSVFSSYPHVFAKKHTVCTEGGWSRLAGRRPTDLRQRPSMEACQQSKKCSNSLQLGESRFPILASAATGMDYGAARLPLQEWTTVQRNRCRSLKVVSVNPSWTDPVLSLCRASIRASRKAAMTRRFAPRLSLESFKTYIYIYICTHTHIYIMHVHMHT